MITQNNLEKIKRHVKEKRILTMEALKEFGFHIGEIAYLIETGRLIEKKDGSYHYVGANPSEMPEDVKFEGVPSNGFESEVLLSILLAEKERIEINTSNSEWKLLEEKSNLLEREKGIVILKAMPEERRHKIYRFAKGIPCLNAFPIDKGLEKKRIVLKSYEENPVNIKKLMESGDCAYRERNFYQSIQCYLEVLTHLRKPTPYLYGKLGLSYMKIGQIKKAIDYLRVADSMYRAKGKNTCFSDLIEELKSKKRNNGDRKYSVPFEETEFQNDMNEYYGLDAIEEMAAFVSSGKSIEEVAIKFSLNEEQLTLLMLLFAKNCYANSDFRLGDKYLKQAEKRKNKTEQAQKLLSEIREKKKFYQYQKSEGTKLFQLTQ